MFSGNALSFFLIIPCLFFIKKRVGDKSRYSYPLLSSNLVKLYSIRAVILSCTVPVTIGEYVSLTPLRRRSHALSHHLDHVLQKISEFNRFTRGIMPGTVIDRRRV